MTFLQRQPQDLRHHEAAPTALEISIQSIYLLCTFLCIMLFTAEDSASDTFMNFDFDNGEMERGFSNWWYSPLGDSSCNIYNAASQSKMCSTPDSSGKVRSFYYYYNGYNSDHMGWGRWGYLDSGETAISGNSLKIVFTGGAYDNNGEIGYSGEEIRSKEQLAPLISQDINPYAERNLPGDLSLYFKTGETHHPFSELVGNDRLSVWILPPEESSYTLDKQQYSSAYRRPENLFSWYPFVVHANGDHYYHQLSNINMGGWIHLVFDAHPVHNNGGDQNPYSYYREGGYDFPGDGVGYFNNVHGFALRAGIIKDLPSPVMIFIDEIETYKADQEENDETIAGIGVGYDPSERIFDISFSDKYRCADCAARYEVRYSFSPITNVNYDSASLCEVVNFNREQNNTNGIIYKPANGYNQIWAALTLREEDRPQLQEGTTIFFAVKDISDRSQLLDRDTYELETVPVSGIGNVRRVDLVKTIDYTIFPLLKTLYFTDNTLAPGHVDEVYLENIPFKGGIKPYNFEIISGSLPDGLNLSSGGELSGTAAEAGAYAFRIQLSESSSFSQIIEQDFDLTIYQPENCKDGIDNDADTFVDCNDTGCYEQQNCSTLLVDFGVPNIYGIDNWELMFKDSYTDVIEAGPGGMTTVVGQNGSYNYQGVAGTQKNFVSGDKILVFWYNNGAETIIFTPRISFEDNDRPDSGNGGSWYLMSETEVEPGQTGISTFTFTDSTAGYYSLVNINVNHESNTILICDKIKQQELDSSSTEPAKRTILGFLPILLNDNQQRE